MRIWYAAAGTAWTMTIKIVPNLSHNFHRVRVLRAIRMPRGKPRARAMAREVRPDEQGNGIFSATMVVMATSFRYLLDSPRSP